MSKWSFTAGRVPEHMVRILSLMTTGNISIGDKSIQNTAVCLVDSKRLLPGNRFEVPLHSNSPQVTVPQEVIP